MTPALIPLTGDRWTPFTATLQLEDIDLTDAALAAQVRLYPDTPFDPLIDLTQVTTGAAEGIRIIYAGSDTVANHIAAGRIEEAPEGMASGDTLALTLLGIRVNESTMEAMPTGLPGQDMVFAWDAHVTPSGELKQRWFYGPFTVRAGVTR